LTFRVNARTVLELGSELISSDIINAFDAGSTTGAVISFDVVLRRNSYLRLRNRALEHLDAKRNTSLTDEMKAGAARALDVSAGTASIEAFKTIVDDTTDLRAFVAALDEAYARMNTIVAGSPRAQAAQESRVTKR
jgi:hypothetical protein